MDPNSLVKEIRTFCKQNQDPEIVTKYSRYFKEGFPGYGLPPGFFEKKVNSLLESQDMTLDLILKTAPLLLKSGKYEETSFVITLTLKFHKQYTRKTFEAAEKWFETGISNWAHSDYFSGDLMQHFFKKGIITLNDLKSWRESANKFQRRAAVVSLIKQLKTTCDFKPFFNFIDPMMMDPEREVHQGLGWFIREAWKKQTEPSEAFLLKWKEKSARLIFQYATEKMTPEQKLRFRRSR